LGDCSAGRNDLTLRCQFTAKIRAGK